MKRWLSGPAVGMVLAAMSVNPAQAQVAWDAPILVSPAAPTGWGVFLADPAGSGGIGVLSTFRPGGPLGYRIGIAEGRGARDNGISVLVGADFSTPLLRSSDDVPFDVSWFTGVGAGIGEGMLISFPLGVSLGYDMEADGVWFNPSIAPRVFLDTRLGGPDEPGDENEIRLGLAVDLGMDLSFDPGWAIRFGASLGDRRALAIGLSFRVF